MSRVSRLAGAVAIATALVAAPLLAGLVRLPLPPADSGPPRALVEATVPVPARKPEAAPDSAEPSEPKDATAAVIPLPQRRPTPPAPIAAADMETEAWTEAEVQSALAACDMLLHSFAIKYEHLPPLREGACGAPALIKVSSIGAGPDVVIAPPAIVTCPLAAALAKWLRDVVQPAARAHLGAPVVRLYNYSSYVCRNRYNEPGQTISEHAFGNALDIGVFESSVGGKVSVLEHWNARIETPPPLPVAAPPMSPVTGTEAAALRHAMSARAGAATPAESGTERTSRQASRLGPAPDESDMAAGERSEAPFALDARARFLRQVHDQACGPFATVLGPEANAAHANHFHLDMAERRNGAYCE